MSMLRVAAAKTGWLRQAKVTPDTLNVAAHLVGAPLARPSQRLWALAVDGIALAMLSNLQAALVGDPPHWMEKWGFSVGWAMIYFTLLPYWMSGQTLGKKLFGLQVVELTGRPLTLLLCLSRYGGYAAGLATGTFGFAQVLWDPNRQAIQDKVAHTVVLDTRAERTLAT